MVSVDEIYTPNFIGNEDKIQAFNRHCVSYARRLLQLNNSIQTTVVPPVPIPGRASTKRRLRTHLDETFFGSEELIQKDIDDFIEMIFDPVIQQRVNAYLLSLGTKKHNK